MFGQISDSMKIVRSGFQNLIKRLTIKLTSTGGNVIIKSFFRSDITLKAVSVEVVKSIVVLGLFLSISSAIVTPDLASPILTPLIHTTLPLGLLLLLKPNFFNKLLLSSLEKKKP